jgi:thioredoxin 1
MQPSAFVSAPLAPRRLGAHAQTLSACRPRGATLMRPARQAPQMLVVEVSSTTEMDTVLRAAGDSLVVVDYSTTWCGPCKVIAPLYEEMSERFTDVVFVKVMGDATPESGELMKREGIRAVPAFHFWKTGNRVLDFTGAKAKAIEEGILEHK